MTKWAILAVLCIVALVAGNWQKVREDEPECRGCKYNNFGHCENSFLCENGEMKEPKEEWKNDRR